MKKLTYIFLSTTFLFFSCSDDTLDSEKIIGSWEVSSVAITNCFDGADNSQKTKVDDNNCFEVDLLRANVCNMTLAVSGDGTATQSFNSNGNIGSNDFDYTVNDETGEISLCIEANCIDAEFQGNNIIWFSPIGGGCVVEYEFSKQ